MGWTVLYIAFGVVALWLLGEVLLQYKARLRWRLLAFAGFLGVVAGVVIPSVAVIVVGALAFAVGQTYVTLSFRRGFDKGWAVRRRPAPAKGRKGGRRRGKGERSPAPEPAPAAPAPAADIAAEETQAFPAAALDDAGTAVLMPDVPLQAPAPGADATAVYPAYGDAGQQQQPYAYGHEHGQEQQYAAYSDPYIGNRQQTYGSYESYETQQAPYGQQQYVADAYAAQHYDMDTPPGGVWVPQQRDTETPPAGEQGYGGQQYRY